MMPPRRKPWAGSITVALTLVTAGAMYVYASNVDGVAGTIGCYVLGVIAFGYIGARATGK